MNFDNLSPARADEMQYIHENAGVKALEARVKALEAHAGIDYPPEDTQLPLFTNPHHAAYVAENEVLPEPVPMPVSGSEEAWEDPYPSVDEDI